MTADDDPPRSQGVAATDELRLLLDRLDGELPAGFRRSAIRLAPGASVSCSDPSWRDALLVLRQGEIEVRTPDGSTACFTAGALVALADIPLSVVHAVGPGPAVLTAVRRGTPRPR